MIILIGPAGAGKSTQGQLLAERLGWNWMSAGQLLREANNPELLKIMNDGVLVPSHFVNELMIAGILL
jgi:adenylate kinase